MILDIYKYHAFQTEDLRSDLDKKNPIHWIGICLEDNFTDSLSSKITLTEYALYGSLCVRYWGGFKVLEQAYSSGAHVRYRSVTLDLHFSCDASHIFKSMFSYAHVSYHLW